VTWAVQEKGYSQRRACGLVGLHPKTYRYASKRTGDEELRGKLRDLASQRRRFGYRRLGLMLRRQGIKLNHKKLYGCTRKSGYPYADAAVASVRSGPGRRWRSRRT
jgi:putative transposase